MTRIFHACTKNGMTRIFHSSTENGITRNKAFFSAFSNSIGRNARDANVQCLKRHIPVHEWLGAEVSNLFAVSSVVVSLKTFVAEEEGVVRDSLVPVSHPPEKSKTTT